MSSNKDIKRIIQHDLSEFERFSSMLSKTVHDVNNPLAVLIGQLSIADLLKQKGTLSPEKLEKIFSKFKSATQTFKDRIELLRNFYKIPINDPSFTKLDQILNSVSYYFENQLQQNDISFNMHLDFNGELEINAKYLFLITKNLLQNSIESLIENETGNGLIELKCELIENSIRLTVADNGPGLLCPLNEASKLGYTTKPEEHSGYGLSIVNELLEDHDLKLEYNKVDKTEFSIVFPTK